MEGCKDDVLYFTYKARENILDSLYIQGLFNYNTFSTGKHPRELSLVYSARKVIFLATWVQNIIAQLHSFYYFDQTIHKVMVMYKLILE